MQEPYLEMAAEDEFRLGRVELVLSVNGEAEQTIEMNAPESEARELRTGHTVFLEELGLDPGDLVAYYARARDVGPDGVERETATDMFFMEVRPFRRDYRQAGSGGGGGQGGQGGEQGNLSAQQRRFVVATFKLVRDKAHYPEEAYRENLATLTRAEGRIRERATAIARRLGGRRLMRQGPELERFQEELHQAIVAMTEAERHMQDEAPKSALPPARKALQHLQRADALFREVRVSLARQGSGQGGAQDAEDLANLFRLEMDKLRNQYEDVQRGQPRTMEQELDAILERLRELAHRQQQENERMRRRAAMPSTNGGGGGRGQRDLVEETEELMRQLERLSRHQPSPELDATRRRLEEAIDAMRQAAENGSGSGAEQGLTAVERLREARQRLDDSRAARLGREIAGVRRQVERLAKQQQAVEEQVRGLEGEGEQRDSEVARLLEQKDEMTEAIRGVEGELDRLTGAARAEQEEASKHLAEASGSIRRNGLVEKIRRSKAAIRFHEPAEATELEAQIGANIEELGERVGEAAAAVGQSRERQIARALEQMRGIARNLDDLRERMGQRSDAGQQPGGETRPGDRGRGTRPGPSSASRSAGRRGGGTYYGGAYGDANHEGQWPGAYDLERFRAEVAARERELAGVRQRLLDAEVDAQDIDHVLSELQAIEAQAATLGPDELARRQAAAAARLKELEFALRKQLEPEVEHQLVLSGTDDVPAAYRRLVEEYYRSLSQGAP